MSHSGYLDWDRMMNEEDLYAYEDESLDFDDEEIAEMKEYEEWWRNHEEE